MKAYLLKETNVINEETTTTVTEYNSEEQAKEALDEAVERCIKEHNAELHFFVMDSSKAKLLDENENEFIFTVEPRKV